MTYEKLIETISEIVENKNIEKKGLSLTYTLNEMTHKKMNESLFYKTNPINMGFVPSDVFEVQLGGILIKFIREDA